MKPQYIRFLVSSNNDLQGNAVSQNIHNLSSIRPLIHHQNSFSSLQIMNRITSSTSAIAPARIIITPTPSTFNLRNEITAQKSNNSSISVPVPGTILNNSSFAVNTPISQSRFIEPIPIVNMNSNATASIPQPTASCEKIKRSDSSCLEQTQRTAKQSKRKLKLDETGSKPIKRYRNWSEDETVAFIGVWSEYYSRLMSGGSRNSSIYQAMANELNHMLKHRSLTGGDVKSKVGNLVTEYRKKRKEQGKTGASPPTWPYYDSIDKLIGERPYNDDSLLSDSMKTEQEQLLEDLDNVLQPDLNSTQISEQVDDCVQLITDTEEINSSSHVNSIDSTNPSNGSSISKSNTSVAISTKTKKNAPSKKKRASDMKIELIQELIEKIEGANDNASRSEIKVLELLEKQTRLQEESMNTEREFLNVFKNVMNNMTVKQ